MLLPFDFGIESALSVQHKIWGVGAPCIDHVANIAVVVSYDRTSLVNTGQV
jgi:hypothetical protein